MWECADDHYEALKRAISRMLEIVPDPRTLEDSGLPRNPLPRGEWESRTKMAQAIYHLAGMPASAAGVPPPSPLVITKWSIYWDGLMTALAVTPLLLKDIFPTFGWDTDLVSDALRLLDRLFSFRVVAEDSDTLTGSVEDWLVSRQGEEEEGSDDE